MINDLTNLSSISIQHYTDAALQARWTECWATIDDIASEWCDEAYEAYERTRAERWSALTTEEQEVVCETSEAEYAARYDVTGGRY